MKKNAPIVITGMVLSVAIYLLKPQLEKYGISYDVLFVGNFFLLGLSVVAVLVQGVFRGPEALVRGYYLSFISKFLLVAVSVLVYVKTAAVVNRRAVLLLFVLYMVYMVIEIKVLIKKRADG